MNPRTVSVLGAILIFLVVGCATSTKRLATLNLGMTKPEVVDSLGQPMAVRGAITNRYGQTIEVWEYHLATRSAARDMLLGAFAGPDAASRMTPRNRAYWLYFTDGQLVQWGEAGDWGKEADRIYEVRFDPAPRLGRATPPTLP
jgi:hypothetical protein